MDTLQKVYRTKLPAEELTMWRETLKDYSVQEFERAMSELVSHPPKYELEDGSIQVWRGMPKLPDVVQVMLDQREKVAAEYRRRESERMRLEFAELEKRRAEHPEEFSGLADVLKAAKVDGIGKITNAMPTKVYPELDLDKNAETLRQQAEKLKAGAK